MSTTPVQQLLRRARRLFSLTGDEPSLLIVEGELRGYPDGANLPLTRVQVAEIRGDPVDAHSPYAAFENDRARIDEAIQRLSNSRLSSEDQRTLNTLMDWSEALHMLDYHLRDWLNLEIIRTYHQLCFGDATESIFEAHRTRVDALLENAAPDAISRLRSVNARVMEGDTEAMSQAINSCRRLIYALADTLIPPASATAIVVDAESHELGPHRHINRIYEHMRTHGTSESRRDHINVMLKTLHGRLSTGLKIGVSVDEARSLVLTTYLVLGEVLLEAPPARDG